MIRLKSTTQAPPNGFRYVHRETGWKSWEANPLSLWDWNLLLVTIQKYRQANPKFRFNTTIAAITEDALVQNGERVNAIPNAESYVIKDPSPPKPLPPPLVDLATRLAAGAGSIVNFLAEGEKPVTPHIAENRALICAVCPQNQQGDFTRWFTQPASELIRRWISQREKMQLKTSVDGKLGVCEACSCPLKLKVHFPLHRILKDIPAESKSALDPKCWILSEEKNVTAPVPSAA